MTDFSQGDVIKISGFKNQLFVIMSKNAFIKATGVFHVSPLVNGISAGPLHIPVIGKHATQGVICCEQIKLIDPAIRICRKTDLLSYRDIINVSDAIQGIFEYD